MIIFKYGGYSFNYNEFQHKLEVKGNGVGLLLDAPNFDLNEMYDIYEHLDRYFAFKGQCDMEEKVLNVLKTDECNPERLLDMTKEVYEFLKAQAYCELDKVNALLGGYKVDEE